VTIQKAARPEDFFNEIRRKQPSANRDRTRAFNAMSTSAVTQEAAPGLDPSSNEPRIRW
jgi:hypothetical protein